MIETYESKTGYVRNKIDKKCFEAKVIYLGIYDKAENYEDISKAVYDRYVKAEEEKIQSELAKH